MFILTIFGVVIVFITGCSSKLFTTVTKGRINSIVLDKQYVWIGTYKDLIKYDKTNDKCEVIKDFLVGCKGYDKTLFIIADDNERLWCGTGGHEAFGSIILFDKKKNTITYFGKEIGLNGAPIWSILVDKTDVWFGGGDTLDKPIFQLMRYNKRQNKWIKYTKNNGILHSYIFNPQISTKRYVWIEAYYGINQYDKKNNKLESITKIQEKELYRVKMVEDNGIIWILNTKYETLGTSNSIELFSYDENKNQWGIYQYITKGVKYIYGSIAVDNTYVWIVVCGYDGGGLYNYNKKTKEWKQCIVIRKKTISPTTQIKVDREHIWFGIGDLGLIRYNVITRKWQRFTTNHGLSGNKVSIIAIDDKYVWVGTSDGLSRIDKKMLSLNIHTHK